MSSNTERERYSDQDVDRIVVAQAEDDSAWDDPVQVHRSEPASLSIPADLAARAAFLARLHRETNVAKWLTDIIRERIELEEAAYMDIKHDLAQRSG